MRVARALGVMVATVALASPAQAALITLNFSGTADLSPFGAAASSSFQGSATWDTTSAPLVFGTNFAYYPAAVSISINSVDHTNSIDPPSTVRVTDAFFGDSFGVGILFLPSADLGPDPDNLYLFLGSLNGPTSMFASSALPTDLNFLSSVTGGGQTQFIPMPGAIALAVGTFVGAVPPATPVPVPEPSTVLLVASSLLGLVCRSRRNRN